MHIKVCFPSGKFYGAQAHDPSKPEWPPHPSRIFSALVASSYYSSNGMTELKRRSLKWLESLPPPSISFPMAYQSGVPITYVPPGDIQEKKGKKGEEVYENPIYRWRQPRHFPWATILGEPLVYYGWGEDPSEDILLTLDEISAGVTHVGTSHSIALIKIYPGEIPLKATLYPDPTGNQFLRIPSPGRLQELDDIFKQSAGVRHPTPLCEPLVAYRFANNGHRASLKAGSDFLSLRISGTMHGADTSAYLGRALRRAVMSVIGNDIPGAVHGHNEEKHVGWLPLPDVGHSFASGRIVGFGVVLPRGLESDQNQKILAGISRVHDLRLPDGRVAKIFPPEVGEHLPVALSQRTWTQPCRTWATVTPVVLDRPPKRLTEKHISTAISESLVFAGFPHPQHVEVSAFSRFQGAPPAFRVAANKPRYHATVIFDDPIEGPIVAGRLRYFGIGLFRPLLSHDQGRPQ